MIPKIIHQLWIGPKTAPINLMNTWRDKHEKEGFEYILWTEDEMKKRNFISKLPHKINQMHEINGKADILRWGILYKYGGVFADADSFCIEPVTDLVEKYHAFFGYENEQIRGKGWSTKKLYGDVLAHSCPLIATGTMGFPKEHGLPKMAIEWIEKNNILYISDYKTSKTAWRSVGPGLLTRLYWRNKWPDITVLPSHLFLPVHHSGLIYTGHAKVYTHQEWGSSFDSYDTMNAKGLSDIFIKPKQEISILISSFNTRARHIKECLDSIKTQKGHYYFEVIWINDGSDNYHTRFLKKLIDDFEKNTRFCKVVYNENDGNQGIGYTLNKGIKMCSNEIIIKMDSDDIMAPDRIEKQVIYMEKNPTIAICGAQIMMFQDKTGKNILRTNHRSVSWIEYKKSPSSWFINHPTVCYRKSKVLEVGNYSIDLKKTWENDDLSHDFELMLRMLKKYGKIHNLPDILLRYRLHPGQVTHNGGKGGKAHWDNVRNQIISKLFSDD